MGPNWRLMHFSTVEHAQSMTNTGLIPQPPSGSSCILAQELTACATCLIITHRRGKHPVLRAAVARKMLAHTVQCSAVQCIPPTPETSSRVERRAHVRVAPKWHRG
ncbi:hypothetical protein BBK36DRAFT_1200672 [Trichoderma citrinoviride]|uniref:Uncharacterized protein n=1 Tax=Trichoderma citrinoviride TaxID=58853 RepID=A0A2T4BAF1_9HYPO|nr:hypothetical protein BBK36DRAFT_1200672 [Trichoderma citrinoviride]PTB66313.1 hypothetical protein BBK36DRAFT_1200672 [Trichoderma citrinoviride]